LQGPGKNSPGCLGTPNFTSISKTAIIKLHNGLPSKPDAEWVLLLGDCESWREELLIYGFCYRTSELGTPAGSDIVIGEMTDQVVAVGEATILELASRMNTSVRPIRLLVACTPPPAMVAMRLQLCARVEELLSGCPALTLAEFCKIHHCPSPSEKETLFHGTPRGGFVTLPPGGFLTSERDFAGQYTEKDGQVLEFESLPNLRVLDIQSCLDELFGLFGGASAADLMRNMKDHRVLSHVRCWLEKKDPNATWVLGLLMQGHTEFVLTKVMQATAVVSASGRRDVTAAEIARDSEQRMAAARAGRYS